MSATGCRSVVVGLVLGALLSGTSASAEVACRDRDPLRRPYFGDTHVHTTFSFDAWGQGTLGTPDDAYRFAKGEPIGMQPYDARGEASRSIRLRRPLDFAVVTDHSDLLGETRICRDPQLAGHASLVCSVMRRFPKLGYALINGDTYASPSPERYSFCGEGAELCLEAARGPWAETREAARAHDDATAACSFTTFVGYEWTGMPNGQNIHRNVIFANDVVQEVPTTYIETPTAEGLWRALDRECLAAGKGCDVIAIPHNSNVSNGLMWTTTRDDGSPITVEDATLRARLERLVEVTQHKGDSECRDGAEDELCAYEKLSYPTMQQMEGSLFEAELPPRIHAREALREGLALQSKLGANPFQFGLIASTDTHLAAPGLVDEDDFVGHAAGTVSARFEAPPYPDRPDFNPGGLAVVWAEENSREALFAAMKRREVFGTSGPRIVARFFAGFELPEDICGRSDRIATAYASGVPMGGELRVTRDGLGATSSDRSPVFMAAALRDPGDAGVPSTALQRLQIVKLWLADGETHERVFEVAGNADSEADVDLATCTPRGAGFDELCAAWRDPEFDASEPAAYYLRVVENPSCRWNSWVCGRAQVACDGELPDGLEACCDESIPKTIQERAWTSPIWFTPAVARE